MNDYTLMLAGIEDLGFVLLFIVVSVGGAIVKKIKESKDQERQRKLSDVVREEKKKQERSVGLPGGAKTSPPPSRTTQLKQHSGVRRQTETNRQEEVARQKALQVKRLAARRAQMEQAQTGRRPQSQPARQTQPKKAPAGNPPPPTGNAGKIQSHQQRTNRTAHKANNQSKEVARQLQSGRRDLSDSHQTQQKSQTQTAKPPPLIPQNPLESAVQDQTELARAIIYAEILGKPLALRKNYGLERFDF